MNQMHDDTPVRWALGLLDQVPTGSKVATEAYITAALVVFLAALRGAIGDEFAAGVMEAQLESMKTPGAVFTKTTH